MNKKLKIKLKRIYHQYKSYGVRIMIRNRIGYIRRWLIEDKANVGLGGPPNNWSGSPEIVVQDGTKSDPTYRYGYSVHFNNDAHEIWINVFETERGENHSHWAFYCSAASFRKMAFWYLWRWAWGEWFGLRRWLFYKWLFRHVQKMQERAVTDGETG